jgi:hypothetical protein
MVKIHKDTQMLKQNTHTNANFNSNFNLIDQQGGF